MSSHSVLFYKKLDEYYSDTNKKKPWTTAELKEIAADILLAKQTSGKKTRRQYHLLSLYDVQEIAGRQIVIKKQKKIDHDPVSIICYEDIFNILLEIHVSVGHGGRDKMLHALQKRHDIARYAVEKLIETCEKNTSYHKVIGRTPYNALFGVDPKVGFSSVNLPKDLLDPIENEDDLVQLLEIPDVENNNLLSCNNNTELEFLVEDTEETREGEVGKAGEKIDEINEKYTTKDGAFESTTKSNNINNSDVDRYKAANVIPNIVTPTLETTNKDILELCITCSESSGTCVLCQNRASIKNNRNEANQGQKRAAEAMLINTAKKLPRRSNRNWIVRSFAS
ncbi:hypothetical protein QE152_g36999 [Popillia japonica]|uniref:Uncharacterized protein n=1 Tax=Popillia japonica TaxID=7064 RepID=A0AAW1IC64_POPJA